MQLSFWDHVLTLVVGALLPLQSFLAGRSAEAAEDAPEAMTTREKLVSYLASSLVLWLIAGAVLWVWSARHGGSGALGLGPTGDVRDSLWLPGAVGFLFLCNLAFRLRSPAARARRGRALERETPFAPTRWREVPGSLVLAISAGFCEEVAFRGHLIPYLSQLGATPALAVLLPALTFALAHRYQGWSAVAQIFAFAAGLGWYYVETGDLWIPIALHALVDAIGLSCSPLVARSARAAAA